MAITITMPALSPTMEEGTLAKWLVKPGDKVTPGKIIAEIETDKATMEVEAVDEGVVAQILVPAGTEKVKVNAVIAILAGEGEDAGALAKAGAGAGVPVAAAAPVAVVAALPPKEAPTVSAPQRATTSPAGGVGLSAVSGPASGGGSSVVTGERLRASPLARRIAGIKGVDLRTLTGSGPHGRIVRADVEAAQAGGAVQAPAAAMAGAPSVPPGGLILPQVLDDRVYAPDSYTLTPLDGMRKVVARRLTESFMQVPHFPLTLDITLDRLLSARAAINAAAKNGVKVSVNDMLIKAAALALIEEPDCNASYTDKGIAYHKSAHVSVAVAVEGGLVTPVIRDAQGKGLAEISEEMKVLAAKARERKLKPQEYMGGTFSISNLGMFGIKAFASILNPPEGMILSVGAGEKRPVVDEKGNLGVATVMTVTLTCDHRVIGGAEGARWLGVFKRFVETPEAMLL